MDYTALSNYMRRSFTEEDNLLKEQNKAKQTVEEFEKLINLKRECRSLVKEIHDHIFLSGCRGLNNVVLFINFNEKLKTLDTINARTLVEQILKEVKLKELYVENLAQYKVRCPASRIPNEEECDTVVSFNL